MNNLETGDRIALKAAMLRLFKGEYRNAGDRHSDALFVKEGLELCQEQLHAATLRAERAEAKLRDSEERCKVRETIPHNAICFFKDGDKWAAVFGDFVSLQESPAGFGDTFDQAFNDLTRQPR